MSNRRVGRRYNFIYSKLVTDENSFAGFIAYCLYKQRKIAWIETFKKQNEGREPTDKQLYEEFSKKTESDYYYKGLMQEAENKKEELLSAWFKESEIETKKLKVENEAFQQKIINPLQEHFDPTFKVRAKNWIKNWGKDLILTFLSIILWVLLFFLIAKLSTPIRELLVDKLSGMIQLLS